MILSRRVLLAGLALAGTKVTAFAQSAPEPQMIPVELIENALNLPSIVRLGHKHGDVIMVEYFDYNCPWCKRSAQALPDLLKAEPELTYVLVNFAVLSPQSVAATRAALGLSAALRARALSAAPSRPVQAARHSGRTARAFRGGAPRRRHEAHDGDRRQRETTQWMKDAFSTGNDLGLVATPSFLIGTEAYIGGMSLEQKREAIARARG